MGVQNLEILKPQEILSDNNDGDHERFSHWVLGGNAAILEAMVNGTPCTALCGKQWVPSKNPERFPVCPDCERIKKEMGR